MMCGPITGSSVAELPLRRSAAPEAIRRRLRSATELLLSARTYHCGHPCPRSRRASLPATRPVHAARQPRTAGMRRAAGPRLASRLTSKTTSRVVLPALGPPRARPRPLPHRSSARGKRRGLTLTTPPRPVYHPWWSPGQRPQVVPVWCCTGAPPGHHPNKRRSWS